MFAGIELSDRICVIRWVGRRGLKVKALLWCNTEADAGNGVVQVPVRILEGGTVPSIVLFDGQRRALKCCEACKTAMRA